jgi:hypothetical protein
MARERWNTVSGLVIDTETRGTGKVIGHLRSRSCTVATKYFASDGVEFSGRDSRFDSGNHRITSFCDNSARSLEAFEIFVTIDGHYEILRSCLKPNPSLTTNATWSTERGQRHLVRFLETSPVGAGDGDRTRMASLEGCSS